MKKTSKKIEYVIALRTSDENGQSYGGFTWPRKGRVVCKDWVNDTRCGHGLHALLVGQNDPGQWNSNNTAVWQVVKVRKSDLVHLNGKVKFPMCTVVYSGHPAAVSLYLSDNYPGAWYGIVVSGGNHSTLTGGYGSKLTGGDYSTLTGGDYSTLTFCMGDKKIIANVGEGGIKANVPYELVDGKVTQKE